MENFPGLYDGPFACSLITWLSCFYFFIVSKYLSFFLLGDTTPESDLTRGLYLSKSFGEACFFWQGFASLICCCCCCWTPCVRTYSKFLSVSGVVLFTFPSLKSAVIRVQGQMWISGFAVIDYICQCLIEYWFVCAIV